MASRESEIIILGHNVLFSFFVFSRLIHEDELRTTEPHDDDDDDAADHDKQGDVI